MRKNVYEEALFKCEDERFEFDININIYKRGILLLEKIGNDETSEEDRKRDFEKLMKLKILQNLYGSKLNEFVDDFNKGESVKKLVEIFLNRLNAKVINILFIIYILFKKMGYFENFFEIMKN